jgi:hypothetical protein
MKRWIEVKDIEYTGEAPSLKDLIAELSGIHVNDRGRRRAVDVAGHLIKFVLGNQWDDLSKRQQNLLIRPSSERIWNNYMHKREYLGQSTKQDAKEVIHEEVNFLNEILNPQK